MHSATPELATALSEERHLQACRHLLREDGQEDLCFALWRPSQGVARTTFLVDELVLPREGERRIHGNASFMGEYFVRALALAMERGAGLAVAHSHLTAGWQPLSDPDRHAEHSLAARTFAATGHPLLGLTIGTDGSWSARGWMPERSGFVLRWCRCVRVVGDRLRMTYHPRLAPLPVFGCEVDRTVSALGGQSHADLVRLRIGILGLGSVGMLVNESVARMGALDIVHIDYDRIERRNRDRLLHAEERHLGMLKSDLAADAAQRNSTAPVLHVRGVDASIIEEDGFRAALDCDVLFCCADTPWPRRVLNQIAYAHLVPVIDGGIRVRGAEGPFLGSDWNIQTIGPGRRCLECIGAYKPDDVALEQSGLLEDPSYVAELASLPAFRRSENVFPFSMGVAALEVCQLIALVAGPLGNVGLQNYHTSTGALDRTDDIGCNDLCLFPGMVARGDTLPSPAGIDARARRIRSEARIRNEAVEA